MSPRQKKPAIRPEERREWLERVENGESATRIAKTDGVDPRTVRKHVEIAVQEKETKEARSSVLRNALERHYADLCRYAETLSEKSFRRQTGYWFGGHSSETPLVHVEQLGIALRQHLSRSPIWIYLNQIPKLDALQAEITKNLGTKIETEIRLDSRLLTGLGSDETDVIPDLVTVMKGQLNIWVDGQSGLNVKDDLKTEPTESDLLILHYGTYTIGKVKKEHVSLVSATITDWTTRVKEMKEYRELVKVVLDIRRLEKSLVEEVAVIVLRRVVPGRCRYCPI